MSIEKSEPSNPEKNARELAVERWAKLGRLGTTAQDHLDVGGSPPRELYNNFGKTEAELMTDEELLQYLKKLESFLESGRKKLKEDPHNDWAREDILSAKKDLRLGVAYLQSIGRLPQEYTDFQVEDLASDP